MKVSIITVCYNAESTIKDAIESVLNQNYNDIEYIVIDGKSSDNTIKVLNQYKGQINHIVSESDNGIYNAMNKGIRLATGDIVGILNADDFFTSSNVIKGIVSEFVASEVDAVYGDVQFVNPDKIEKVVRYYSSKHFTIKKFRYGFMPAHPSFYVKRDFYIKYGLYKEDYKIGSDYDLLVRFLYVNKLKTTYLNFPLVNMRTGGISNSSYKSLILLNKEILRACKENGIQTNLILIYLKYFRKVFELIFK